MYDDSSVHVGSGNVFADLEQADAQELLVKAMMSRLIDKAIERRGLTQEQAAALLGCSQPDISKIVRGRVGGFSIERLARFLTMLGHDVEIRVSTAKEDTGDLVLV